MKNIFKLLLIVLFIEITFESKVSTIQKNSPKKEIEKLNAAVKQQNKPLKKINITKPFLKCLNKTTVIPNQLLRAISTQKSITVTNDYEYIFPPYYNETISQKINKKIRECSNENNVNKNSKEKQNELSVKTRSIDSGLRSVSQCNLEACAECIIKAKITNKKKFYSKKIDEHLKTITTTINNLLSQFESEQDKYGKINECICNSHCRGVIQTNKKCQSN